MAATIAAPAGFWVTEGPGASRSVFAAQGIRCAGCVNTIERAVRALPGIERVDVNVATARVAVQWRRGATDLGQILAAIASAGYKPVPLAGEATVEAARAERRTALKRIGLAGIGMMQTMMTVLGVYIAKPGGIDPAMAQFLLYVGMLMTTPVLFYSGAPFLAGAWRGLRERALNMDFTVALALLLAYGASVFNTLRGAGQTYFDSVTMFVFFLSAGRYVEMSVRQRNLSTGEAVSRSLPAWAARLRADGTTERVPLRDIAAGDRLSIVKGAVIPVDAELAEGAALVDESLITGESTPVRRVAGEPLLGGGVNTGNPIVAIARRDVTGSALASIVALLERAQTVRPRLALAADRIASRFIGAIVALAVIVAIAWTFFDPARAFPAALAVLVVTCPCALSLATPVAVAAATTKLARMGLLVTRADALERLAHIDTVLLDKTGTLTGGEMAVVDVKSLNGIEQTRALAFAAALERGSQHPIARAFIPYADATVVAQEISETEGQGIAGRIDGKLWRLGRAEFAAKPGLPDGLYLSSDEMGAVAMFEIGDRVRPGAQEALGSLRRLGVTARIASGDRPASVSRVAQALGIDSAASRLSPAEKSERVRRMQREGRRILAIGDGVNDGPLLATADVSCAMGEGSAVAQAAADFLLLNDSLAAVARAVGTARQMERVIRQNLRWALIYNFAAVPLAALNLVPPWLAAIGMSASSLVVVLNARRLARGREAV